MYTGLPDYPYPKSCCGVRCINIYDRQHWRRQKKVEPSEPEPKPETYVIPWQFVPSPPFLPHATVLIDVVSAPYDVKDFDTSA